MYDKLSLLALLAAFAAPVIAQNTPASVDQRQANQERRIDQGIQSGTLTDKEAKRLDRGQDKVDRIENRAMSDGTVTNKEKARLQQAENVQSRHIKSQKHDGQHDLNHNDRNDRSERRAERRQQGRN